MISMIELRLFELRKSMEDELNVMKTEIVSIRERTNTLAEQHHPEVKIAHTCEKSTLTTNRSSLSPLLDIQEHFLQRMHVSVSTMEDKLINGVASMLSLLDSRKDQISGGSSK